MGVGTLPHMLSGGVPIYGAELGSVYQATANVLAENALRCTDFAAQLRIFRQVDFEPYDIRLPGRMDPNYSIIDRILSEPNHSQKLRDMRRQGLRHAYFTGKAILAGEVLKQIFIMEASNKSRPAAARDVFSQDVGRIRHRAVFDGGCEGITVIESLLLASGLDDMDPALMSTRSIQRVFSSHIQGVFQEAEDYGKTGMPYLSALLYSLGAKAVGLQSVLALDYDEKTNRVFMVGIDRDAVQRASGSFLSALESDPIRAGAFHAIHWMLGQKDYFSAVEFFESSANHYLGIDHPAYSAKEMLRATYFRLLYKNAASELDEFDRWKTVERNIASAVLLARETGAEKRAVDQLEIFRNSANEFAQKAAAKIALE